MSRRDVDLLRPGQPRRLLERARPDAVVHLAWCASGTPGYRHSADNARWTEATLELHDACRETAVPLWVTGTVVDDDPVGQDAYSVAKSALRAALTPSIVAGEIGWLRPAYVFDEGARRPELLAYALAGRDRGQEISLLTPESAHDFVHASDVGRAVATALEHRLTGLLPIGSGTTHSVAELVTALGVRWHGPVSATAPVASHTEAVADISWLRGYGWAPDRTERLLGRATLPHTFGSDQEAP